MKGYLIVILIGLVSGFLGIIPMLRARTDKYFIFSAFVLYFMMPYVIYHMNLPIVKWWLKGSVITLALSLPLALASAKNYKKVVFPVLLVSVLVGGFITFLGHFLL